MVDTCVLRAHELHDHIPLTPRQVEENRAMTKVRIAVEWSFGRTGQLFALSQHWQKQQLRKHDHARYVYFVATLLRNAHVCLYGSIVSTYFQCQPPTLEEFFHEQV